MHRYASEIVIIVTCLGVRAGDIVVTATKCAWRYAKWAEMRQEGMGRSSERGLWVLAAHWLRFSGEFITLKDLWPGLIVSGIFVLSRSSSSSRGSSNRKTLDCNNKYLTFPKANNKLSNSALQHCFVPLWFVVLLTPQRKQLQKKRTMPA